MKIKYRPFKQFLSQASFADVELILKAKKLSNGNFAIITSYELTLEQLKSMDITLDKKGSTKVMPRESKPPKWAIPLILKVDSIDKRLDVIEQDIKVMKQDIKDMKNTPTMKRELKAVKQPKM